MLIARVLSAALQALVVFVLAANMPTPAFGSLASILNLLLVGYALGDLGIEPTTARARARGQESLVTRLLQLQRVHILVLFALSIILILSVNPGNLSIIALAPVSAAAAMEKRTSVRYGFLIAARRTLPFVIGVLMVRLPALLGAAAVGHYGLLAFSLLYLLGALTQYVYLLFATPPLEVRNAQPDGESISCRSLYSSGFHFWIAIASAQIRNLDIALVGAVLGAASAAPYAIAARVAVSLRILPTAFASVSFIDAARPDQDMPNIRRLIMLPLLLSVTVAGSVFAAAPLIPRILGSSFAGAVTPLRILVLAVVLNAAGAVLSGTLQGRGLERSIGRLGGGLAAIQVSLAIPFMYWWGPEGMALSVLLVNAIQLLAVASLFRRWRRRGV